MKNISVWASIGIFLIGFLLGYGRLEAKTARIEKDVDIAQIKIEKLTSATDKMDVKQEAIKEDIGDVDKKLDKLIELMLEQKERENVPTGTRPR